MEARAYLRNARIAPRKVQIVLDLIRNKPVDIALATRKKCVSDASGQTFVVTKWAAVRPRSWNISLAASSRRSTRPNGQHKTSDRGRAEIFYTPFL